MSNRTLSTLKLIALVFTFVLALIAIMYILGLFPGQLGRVFRKIIAIMAILTAASLITIFLTGSQKAP